LIVHRFRRPPAETSEEVAALVVLHGPERAWLQAHEGLRDALENRHWLDEDELRRRRRHWHSIIREVEREIGRMRQRDLLRNMEER
jgi:hypothetical protein